MQYKAVYHDLHCLNQSNRQAKQITVFLCFHKGSFVLFKINNAKRRNNTLFQAENNMNLINLEYVIILSFEFSESNVQH